MKERQGEPTLLDLERSLFRGSYYDFFREMWDTVIQDEYVHNWHIETLCNELQQIGERLIARRPKTHDLVINISPGESKSTICTVLFPAWLWARDPSLRIISGSYSASLSMSHAVKTKDCLKSQKYRRLFGDTVQIRDDIDAKQHYKTTAKGERLTTSTGAGITGEHGHIIIIDDPLNPEQAASEAAVNTAARWIRETLPSRVVDKRLAPTIMIMQRLHANDPTAVMLSMPGVRHLCLPAEDSFPVHPPELRSMYVNGIMNPARKPLDVLEKFRAELGSTAYSGQFGQQPSDPEGGIIKRAWWQRYEAQDVPPGIVWDMWIDGAYTKSAANDPTGIMVAGYDRERNRLLIRYAEAARMEMPDLLRRVKDLAGRYGLTNKSRVYVEPKASGLSIIQLLKETAEVSPVKIEGRLTAEGKEARIQVSAPRVESGMVLLSNDPSCEVIVYQNADFPRADHDEFVDLLGYACNHYFTSKRAPVRSSTY